MLMLMLLALGFAGRATSPTTLHCDALGGASHSPAFCASVWATGLKGPRKVVVTPAGTVLVLDMPVLGSDGGRVLALWDDDTDGYSDESERATLLESVSGLGQGMAARGGYIYASTGAAVRRWPYADGMRSPVGRDAEHTVVQCNQASGLTPRDLVIDGASQSLYVLLGGTAPRQESSVRKFALGQLPPTGTFDCADGTLIVGGLHSEQLSIALDRASNLWVVQGDNTTTRLEPPLLTLAGPGAPSSMAFFGGTGSNTCVNTSRWTLSSRTAALPYYDYNLNGCPDSWEGDGHCDENHETGCPLGSDSVDCNGGDDDSHNGCDGGSFPCHMLGDAFIALSGGGSEGHKVQTVPLHSMAAPGSPDSDIVISELLSNGN